MINKILFLFVTFILVSSSYSQQIYKNKDYGFTIKFPDGWEIKGGNTGDVIVRAVLDELTEISVVQQSKEGVSDSSFTNMGVNFFCQKMIERFQSMLQDYKTVEYNGTKVSGIKAYYINYTCSVGGKKMNSRQYFFAFKGVMFVITAGCADDDIDKYKTIFEDCVNSMSFY